MANKKVDTGGAFVIKSANQVGAIITAISRDAKSLDVRIHDAAVQCLAHAALHGDVTLMDRLRKAIRNGNEIEAWCRRYSPIRWNGDGKVGELKASDKTFVAYALEGEKSDEYGKRFKTVTGGGEAGANPFWALPEVAAANNRTLKEASIFGVIENLGERITKAVAEERFVGDADHAMRRALALKAADDAFIKAHPIPNIEAVPPAKVKAAA